ncbi:hypothetical protein [Streptomyces sp. ISL-36]|uniref:hypothetical protein n=1 Tax=Streptomyces sp. ISL-36 TaxID=2819182 RepID=UPI00203588DA|nr:hypothetical protein [Streptomyces sp. ISL-36]
MQAAPVKAPACQLPVEAGAPLSRWSCRELARKAVERGIVPFLSASTVRRWLDQDAIKPWQHRSWISSPTRTSDQGRPCPVPVRPHLDGEPLGADEYVISADEKTSIQARCRCHPTLAPGQARAMRVNHTYGRGGALAYLAALRRPPSQGVRPLRANHRHRPVHDPGHPGHEPGTLRERETRVLDRRQRLLPPRQGRSGPADGGVPERGTDPLRCTPPG